MSKLLAVNSTIFFVLATICFCAFAVGLMWYIISQKKSNPKQTKSWTIESAKKFLESQNIEVSSNAKANSESSPSNARIQPQKKPNVVKPISSTTPKTTTPIKKPTVTKTTTPTKTNITQKTPTTTKSATQTKKVTTPTKNVTKK